MTSAAVPAISAGSSSVCASHTNHGSRESGSSRRPSLGSAYAIATQRSRSQIAIPNHEDAGSFYFRNRNSRPIFTRFTPLYSMMSAVA
jgi:hypothetical protein